MADPCANVLKFTVNDNGTAQDLADDTVKQCNGLVWQRTVPVASYNWQGAKDYCDGLNYGGSNDWRLPNIDELFSIVDKSRVEPAIDVNVFPNTPNNFYWSSTRSAGSSSYAWYVSFGYGDAYASDVGDVVRVRCVR